MITCLVPVVMSMGLGVIGLVSALGANHQWYDSFQIKSQISVLVIRGICSMWVVCLKSFAMLHIFDLKCFGD